MLVHSLYARDSIKIRHRHFFSQQTGSYLHGSDHKNMRVCLVKGDLILVISQGIILFEVLKIRRFSDWISGGR